MKKAVAIVVLSVLAVASQFALSAKRPVKSPAVEEGIFAALGGLRSIVAEIVWFRADRLQEEGRYVELAQLAHALALAEPHTPEVWSYASWNLAYNVSVMMQTGEDRWRWVEAAMSLIRDDGLRINPSSAELYRELAWLFELKIGADLDDAAPVYRRKWREIVTDVERRGAWEELSMNPMVMNEIEAVYGISDRADAMYSAIYWAHLGLKHAKKGVDARMLETIVRQAVVIYRRRKGGTENG